MDVFDVLLSLLVVGFIGMYLYCESRAVRKFLNNNYDIEYEKQELRREIEDATAELAKLERRIEE